MPQQLFAYTLAQVEQGWTWSLWDEDGGVVAAGAAPDQPSAERRLFEALERTHGATPAARAAGARPTPLARRRQLHASGLRLARSAHRKSKPVPLDRS